VSTAIEFMIKDILVAADSTLHISRDIYDMNRYIFLNDSIVGIIERSTMPALDLSRRLLRRLRTRDLYRFADQTLIPLTLLDRITEETLNRKAIHQYCNQDLVKDDDIIVQWLVLNYALKDKNPVDSVSFFTKYDTTKKVLQ
jgi:hypothetical protein